MRLSYLLAALVAVASVAHPSIAQTVNARSATAFIEDKAAALGGNAIAVSSGITLPTSTQFLGELTTASGTIAAGGVLANSPAVSIIARIRTAAADIGQPAEILMVARYNDIWYMKSPQGWQVWDRQLSTLAAVRTLSLSALENLDVQQDLVLPGNFDIYVGYRRQGVVVYSPNPLSFSLVTGADLRITEFSAPTNAKSADLLDLNVTLNNYSYTAANTTLRFYQSNDSTINATDSEICTETSPVIAPLANSQHRCQAVAPSTPKTYYYGVCADNIANETELSNNCSRVATVNVAPYPGGAEPLLPTPELIPSKTHCASPQILANGQCIMPDNIPKPTYQLNDTGVNACATANNTHNSCPNSNYPIQDGDSGRDNSQADDNDGHAGFSFTKISSTGQLLNTDATEWSCVKDNVTGLIWEIKTNDQGLHDQHWTYSWHEPDNSKNGGGAGLANGGDCGATSQCDTLAYIQAVNTVGWCGAHDWRLPTVDELLGLSVLDRINPALDTRYFPNTPNTWFWSATAAGIKEYAWYVFANYGLLSWNGKDQKGLIRLVRG